jgi:glycosyltransferase involved in cell wall biosynthesis
MDAVVHTSPEPESFARVIVAGIAATRPMIAAAAGGVTGIVRDGWDGGLLKSGVTTALADAIGTLRADPALAHFAKRGAE